MLSNHFIGGYRKPLKVKHVPKTKNDTLNVKLFSVQNFVAQLTVKIE